MEQSSTNGSPDMKFCSYGTSSPSQTLTIDPTPAQCSSYVQISFL